MRQKQGNRSRPHGELGKVLIWYPSKRRTTNARVVHAGSMGCGARRLSQFGQSPSHPAEPPSPHFIRTLMPIII